MFIRISRMTLTAAVVGLTLAALGGPASARTAATSFADPAGDSNGAPDIQAVDVSDDVKGNLVFRSQTDAPTRPADAALYVYVDADRNQSTGGYNDGIDYVVGVAPTGFGVAHVTSQGALAVEAHGAGATWQGGVATIAV